MMMAIWDQKWYEEAPDVDTQSCARVADHDSVFSDLCNKHLQARALRGHGSATDVLQQYSLSRGGNHAENLVVLSLNRSTASL